MSFYLDQINPLAGLDQAGVLHLISMGQRGYFARLQWLYSFIEKRDPTVRAVKRRLLASLSGLDWNIKHAESDDPAQHAAGAKQAEQLRDAYNKIENLREALVFLALAELRGFSHLEKVYRGAIDPQINADSTDSGTQKNNLRPSAKSADQQDSWDVIELRIVEQWFWAKNGFYGDWLYNQDAREVNSGEPIDPAHYIIHTVADPADEIFAELAVKRKVNDADWDGFLEDYGVPPMFIIGPPNVPVDREAQYQSVAEAAVSAARGYLPNGASLATPSSTGSGGAGVFSERLKYIDEQIVIAGTSGQLTILSKSGSGTLAGNAQKEAFDEIAQAIVNQVATTLHAQFDKPLLDRLFPGEPALAYFEFAQINVQDTSAIFDDAVKASTAGYRISPEELSEKTGYDLEYVGVAAAVSAAGKNVPLSNAEEKTNLRSSAQSADEPQAVAAATASTPADPVESVASSLHVTPEFVAPAKSVIDELIARAQSGPITAEDLQKAAEATLKRMPELALQTDISGVTQALQAAMFAAANPSAGGQNAIAK